MERLVVKGEKIVIGKRNEGLNHLTVELTHSNPDSSLFDIDIFIFMVDEKNQVHKKNIIFYNNCSSICESIQYRENFQDIQNIKNTEINLNKMPQNIKKIVLGCSIYRDENVSKSKNTTLIFKVFDKMTNIKVFEIEEDINIWMDEAVILGDIYQYKDMWKFNTLKYKAEGNILNLIKKLYDINIY